MPNTRILKDTVKRGDAWAGSTITVTKTSFDFTGTTVKLQWRSKPDASVYLTQNPSCSYPSLGTMTFAISLTGAETATFPKGIMLTDIQISRTSPLFGPFTPIEIQLEITLDITQ